MMTPSPRSRIRMLLLATALPFALPWAAHAQATVTAHELTIALKGVGQMTTDAGDLKEDKFTARGADLFTACVGQEPARTERIYLFLNCDDFNDNRIAAIDTAPFSLVENLGSVQLDLANLVVTTKRGTSDWKTAKVPALIDLDCGEAVASLRGILNVTFKALAEGGEICPYTAKLKVIGTGFGDEFFIVNDGSSMSAKKPSTTITSFPTP